MQDALDLWQGGLDLLRHGGLNLWKGGVDLQQGCLDCGRVGK